MQYPKHKKRTCKTDGCYNDVADGAYCPACNYASVVAKKRSKIAKWRSKAYTKKKTPLDKAVTKADRGTETAAKLLKEGLLLWSEVVRGEEEYGSCITCPKTMPTRGGIRGGLHAGHFLDKTNHWKLSLEIENGGKQCPSCNCDFIHNPRRVELMKIEMRSAMIKIHGEEVISDLERRGEEFRLAVKQGRENSKPNTKDMLATHYGRETDMEFLKRKIKELKQILQK